MSRYRSKKIVALLLTVMILCGTACGKSVGDGKEVSGAGTVDTETSGETENATDAGNITDTEHMEETESAEGQIRLAPEWTKDAVLYEVNVRQYTEEGTFAAFAGHLQELKDMGITTLWFMPIHPISETRRAGVLGSYYSITDYRAVNPEFGTAEDFAALVEQAHDMGFTVMMDWVANHTGWDCAWIKEHPDWYTQDENGSIISPAGMGWPDVADLNYDSQDMRMEMIDCMKYWVEEYDIDGFRCDYANGVPVDFWEEAREELEAVKPVYMLAEDSITKELLASAFDMNYNWGLYDTLVSVAKDAKQADKIRLYIPKDYPDGTYALNFLDNHDKNSYERTIYEGFGEDALPAMFTLVYTIPGVPLVYSGDEVGLDQTIEFMQKDTINWDTGRSYRELLKELADIRKENPALYTGNYGGEIQYYEVGSKNALAFYRTQGGNTIKGIFNLSRRDATVNLAEVVNGSEDVLLHGQASGQMDMEDYPVEEDLLLGADSREEIILSPWEFYILAEEE